MHQKNPVLNFSEGIQDIITFNSKEKIYGGDLVYISHVEKNSLLTADIIYPEPRKVSKKIQLSKKSLEKDTFDIPENNTGIDNLDSNYVTYLVPEHKSQQVFFKEYSEKSDFKHNTHNLFSIWEVDQLYSQYPGDLIQVKNFEYDIEEKISLNLLKTRKRPNAYKNRTRKTLIGLGITNFNVKAESKFLKVRHFVSGKY